MTAVYGGHVRRASRAPTTTSTGCAPSSPASTRLGVRQRQRPHLLRRGLQDPRLRGGRAARLAGARPRRRAGRLGQPADQGGQGLRASSSRSGCSTTSRACGSRAPRRPGCSPVATAFADGHRRHPAGQAPHHRQVARHRQPGRRLVRARDDPRAAAGLLAAVTDDEIIDGHPPAGPDRGDLRRDRRRGDHRHAWPSWPRRGVVRRDERVVAYRDRPRAQDRRGPGRHASGPPPRSPPTPRGRSTRPSHRRAADGERPMSVTVRIPTQLRTLTGGAGEVGVEGATVRRGAQGARRRPPRVRPSGSSTTTGSCAASSTSSWPTRTSASSTGLDTPVADGQTLSIVPAVAGG